MTRVIDNLQRIQQNIDAACAKVGRNPEEVTIIAVTKQVTTARAEEALAAGIHHLGENRPEPLLEKQETITDGAVWHYIGSLQTRKVRKVLDTVDFIHSLDRLSLAEEINKRATKTVNCFVQVNVSGEDSKHGLAVQEVEPFIEQLKAYDHIRVVGLMTMAPNTEDDTIIRNTFKGLKELQLSLAAKQYEHAPCTELSMGMSHDYAIAVEEGSTYVRIGTALVGLD